MTTKTHAITSATLRAVAKEAEAALRAVGAKHGVRLVHKSGTYGAVGSLKFDVLPVAADGTAVTREADTFAKLAGLYGLSPSDLGRTFTLRGESWTLVGANTGMKLVVRRARNGKDYLFKADALAAVLKKAPLASGLTETPPPA